MPRRTFLDTAALESLLREREQVVTHRELRALGVPPSTITYRMRRAGPWQRILPGVVLTHRGTPTGRERELAAVRYAGPAAVITGVTALNALQVHTPGRSQNVLVLVPHTSQRSSFDFVTIRRSRQLPEARLIRGVSYALPARAVVDASRELKQLDNVRELVAAVIQGRHCTLAQLSTAVHLAARQRSALSREVLREMGAGIRAVSEAKARRLLAESGVPQPLWNCEIFTPDGELLAVADGLWEDVMAALEIDSMAWHLSPNSYKRTQRRQRRLIIAGVPVLPVAPGDIIDAPDEFIREALQFRAEAARRELPNLRISPAAGQLQPAA